MQKKRARAIRLDTCGDNRGPLLKIGRKGSKYFIDKVGAAHSPNAGRTTRTFMKTKRAAEKSFADGCDYRGLS